MTPKRPEGQGFASSFAQGFKRSLPETKSLLYGAGAAVAGAVGADGLRDAALEKYREVSDTEVAPLSQGPSFREAVTGDGKVADWAGDVLGNFAGQAAQSAVTGVAGAVAGGRAGGRGGALAGGIGGLVGRGAVKDAITGEAEKLVAGQVAKGAARETAEAAGQQMVQKRLQQLGGATAATTGLNVAQESGISYTGRADDAAAAGETLDQQDALRALGAGAVAGVIDTAAEATGVGRILEGASDSAKMGRRIAAGAARGALTEGGTEAAQAAIERYGAQRALTGEAAVNDYVENFAAGALGGSTIGGASGIRPRRPVAPVIQPAGELTRAIAPETAAVATQPARFEDATPGTLSDVANALPAAAPAAVPAPNAAEALAQMPLVPANPRKPKPDDSGFRSTLAEMRQRNASALDPAAVVPQQEAMTLAAPQVQAAPTDAAPAAPQGSNLPPPNLDPDTGELLGIDAAVWPAAADHQQPSRILEALYTEARANEGNRAPGVSRIAETYGVDKSVARAFRNETVRRIRDESMAALMPPTTADAPLEAPAAPQTPLAPPADATAAADAAGAPQSAAQAVYDESPDVQDTDITPPSGGPFESEGAAGLAATRAGEAARVVPVDGGFVVRTPQAALPATPEVPPAADQQQMPEPAAEAQPPAAVVAPEAAAVAAPPQGVPAPAPPAAAPASKNPMADRPSAEATTASPAWSRSLDGARAEAARLGIDTAGKGLSKLIADVKVARGRAMPPIEAGGAQPASPVAAAAATAATSPANDLPQPTQAQKEAGNYRKGHVVVNGHDISIENPAGSQRDPKWPPLANHYGYIKGTIGRDKDHVDVFMTDRAEDPALPVFVIDQRNKDGSFDEHKVVMGATDEADARATYLANYSPGWTGLGAITEMTQAQFRVWVRDSKQTKRPAAKAARRGAAAAMAPAAVPPAAPAAVPPAAPAPERRQDAATREAIDQMPSDARDAEIARLRAEVAEANRRADTDARTGIKGPGAYDRDLAAAGGVAAIDLKLFKGYNTLLTDKGGDQVLAAFGAAMREAGGEQAYRRGGDEFAFLADSPEAAQAMVDRLREAEGRIVLQVQAGTDTFTVDGVPFAAGVGADEDAAIQSRDAGKGEYDRNALPGNVRRVQPEPAADQLAGTGSDGAGPARRGEDRRGDAGAEGAGRRGAAEVTAPPPQRAPAPAPAINSDLKPKVYVADGVARYREQHPQTLAAYYQPGRIVRGYSNSFDRILEFTPAQGDRGWSVRVIEVRQDGSPIPDKRPRTHSTVPTRRELVEVFGPPIKGKAGKAKAKLSKGDAAGGLPMVRAQALKRDLTAKWGEGAPRVVLVESAEALQVAAGLDREVLDDPDFYRAEGLYNGSPTVWINLARIPDEQRFAAVLAHEALGHYGVERVVGAEEWRSISGAIARHRAGASGAQDVRDAIARVEQTQPGLDADPFASEVVAVLAEMGSRNNLLQRVIAAVNRFLRRVMPGYAWRDTDIRDLLNRADSFMRAGTPAAARAESVRAAAFSRAALSMDGRGARRIAMGGETFVDRGGTFYLAKENGEPRDFVTATDAQAAAAATGGEVRLDPAMDGERSTWSVVVPPTQVRAAEVGGFATLFSKAAPADALADIEAVMAGGQQQGMLAKARAWLADMTPAKLKDAARETWLGALTTRHLTELGSDYLPTMKTYTDILAEMGADRNKLQAESEELVEGLRKWSGKNQAEAQLLFKLMHDSTIDGLDPSVDYQPLMLPAFGGVRLPATRKNLKAYIKAQRELMLGRAGDSKVDRMNDVKAARAMVKAEEKRLQAFPALVQRYAALSPEAKQYYAEVRDAYRSRSDAIEEALIARIEDTDAPPDRKAKMISMLRQQFETHRLQGVYFPLQRFGRYFVAAERDGTSTFLMFEKLSELERAVKDLKGRGFAITAQGLKGQGKAQDAPSGTFVAEVVEQLRKSGVSEKTQDEVYQIYLEALPELSMRKHAIHRKAVPGFDPDAVRALAFNMHHGAHQLARLRHGHKLQAVLGILSDQQDADRRRPDADTRRIAAGDAILGELGRRHEWINNPQDSKLTNIVSSFGFVYYLGVSPAAALVNLTQTAMVSYPFLAARFGGVKAMNYLLAAGRDSIGTLGNIQKRLTDPDEQRAHAVLQQMGALDKTQAHNLAGIAESGMAGYSPKWAKAMEIIGWGFHKTEVVNREATGMAAFRLARAEGKTFNEAVDFAAQAIHDTHFDYCVDTKTECLTTSGWKRFDELKTGDVAVSVDSQGRATLSRVTAVNVFEGDKEVMLFTSSQRFSMALTNEHDAAVQVYSCKKRGWGKIKKVKAAELKRHHHILRAPLEAIDHPPATADEVAFAAILGWIAAEGQLSKFRNCKKKTDVRLAQSAHHNPEYVREIRAHLAALGSDWSEYSTRAGEMIVWTLKGELRKRVLEAMPDKLLSFKMVERFTPSEQAAIIDAFCKGDGHQRKCGGWTVTQKRSTNAQNLEVLQAMAVLTGLNASLRPSEKVDMSVLILSAPGKEKRSHIAAMNVTREKVDTVWCPTTANGMWVARRNGAVFVTGNSNANRARFMQSGTAKILLMFRQYSLNMTWHLARMVWQASKGETPEVKRTARRNLAGILGMSALFSGVLGLPMASVAMGVLNSVAEAFGDDDEPWNAETEFRAFLADMLGPDIAETLLTGAANQVTGADIGGRVSLNQLWFRDADRELDGRGAYYNLLEQAAGPMGGVLKNALVGKQLMEEGHVWRGVETMLPKSLKDGMKAIRFKAEGVNNLRGDAIVEDVNLYQALLQVNGFSPKQVAERYDQNRALKNYETAITDRRRRLIDGYAMAHRLGDNEAIREYQRKIDGFNESYPQIAITGKTIRTSIKNRARYSEQAENGIFLNPKLAEDLRARVGVDTGE